MRGSNFKMVYVLIGLGFVLLLGSAVVASTDVQVQETQSVFLDLVDQIRDTVILANITMDTPAYDAWENHRKKIGEFESGEIVEIVRDRAFEWYLVKADDGREGWISVKSILIPSDPETNHEWLPQSALEIYVNQRSLTSKTDHLVWVDIDRQLTHVFTGKQGNWKLKHSMPCSTGKNVSPTLRGMHEIAERGDWFFTERLARGGQHWVQFAGPYLFHSLPMDKQRNIMDYTLLERRSSGCIRLSMEDSVWFYSFIKRRSTVFVN